MASATAEQAEAVGVKLTDTEIKFLANAMQCMKTAPELDYDKLAAQMGLAKKTVTNRWWELKKKLFAAATVPADDAEGVAPLPKTPAKRKAKAAAPAQDKGEDADMEPGSAAKKAKTRAPRGPSKKKAAAAAAAAAAADDDDGAPPPYQVIVEDEDGKEHGHTKRTDSEMEDAA